MRVHNQSVKETRRRNIMPGGTNPLSSSNVNEPIEEDDSEPSIKEEVGEFSKYLAANRSPSISPSRVSKSSVSQSPVRRQGNTTAISQTGSLKDVRSSAVRVKPLTMVKKHPLEVARSSRPKVHFS